MCATDGSSQQCIPMICIGFLDQRETASLKINVGQQFAPKYFKKFWGKIESFELRNRCPRAFQRQITATECNGVYRRRAGSSIIQF